jgi:4-hydroxythreonine-4-phosphate dehydrogenase
MLFEARTRPRLALTVGDPAGIGPEIVAKALLDPRSTAACDLVAIGPANARPTHVQQWNPGDRLTLTTFRGALWHTTPSEKVEVGRVSRAGGAAALAALKAATDLCLADLLDGMVNGPVSKEAMHLAGEQVEGQSELLGRWAKAPRMQMLAVAGNIRVLLLSRHMSLRAALELVTTQRVHEHLQVLHDGLLELGLARPKLALAGLNPHAGENGLLGSEDGEILVPAVERARKDGLDVHGPVSPDSVFVQAAQRKYDGVLALYHDQAFIPVKLHAPTTGLTVLVGMPFLRVSPAHGTAMDIAGRNKASAENLLVAIEQAAEWAMLRRNARARRLTL